MSQLFSPCAIGPLTLKNRIVIAPMCQYSAIDGQAQPWHVQHIGRLATSGAGAVIIEATGVEAAGRITPDDLGLWNDEQEALFQGLLKGVRTYSDTPVGVQLAHAGRKASTSAPWKGGAALAQDDGAWTTYAPSALPFRDGWPEPREMTLSDMDRVVTAFVEAAKRADRAGFDFVELHAAHGYLLCEFLSPLTNRRDDDFGGSAENRARFPLRVARALRDAWPRTKAVGVRFNGSDWTDGGVSLDEVTAFGRALHDMGYDYLHMTSGGNVPHADIPGDRPGYQLAFAEAMKAAAPEANIIAVGMIFDPRQAETIVASGQADLVAVARAVLDDPNWGHHAAAALGQPQTLPPQYERAGKAFWPGYGKATT